MTAGREAPLALFLFSHQPNAYPKGEPSNLEPTSREIGALLFRQVEMERFLANQEELLRSQIRAGALHDVRHALGTLGLTLNLLERQTSQPASGDVDRETIHILALELRGIVNQMTRTAELSLDLARGDRIEPVDVNASIRRIVERQKLLASHWVVQLAFDLQGKVPAILINPAHLQQVLDNLVLNALQWSAGRPVREVQVKTRLGEPGAAGRFIEIRVQDSGPGIHHRLQKQKIFELGFSTRKEGSGLGLFVVRALLESLGGRVSVEESIMQVGTVFLVEIPVEFDSTPEP
jgi:signal transduction histidine kinase